jgi:tetratricopeptide (TPR) repeat protein
LLLATAWAGEGPASSGPSSRFFRRTLAVVLAVASVGVFVASGARLGSEVLSRSALRGLSSENPSTADAIRAHRRALALAPGNIEARRALVHAELLAGHPQEAEDAAREAVALAGDSLDWSWLGKALLAQGREDAAAEAFQRAARLDPRRESRAVYAAWTALRRWERTQSREAILALEEALERLRLINFRHPLIALSDGRLAEANGASRQAREVYRQGLARLLPEPATPPASPEEKELAALEGQVRAILRQEVEKGD